MLFTKDTPPAASIERTIAVSKYLSLCPGRSLILSDILELMNEVTRFLGAIEKGDLNAAAQLFPLACLAADLTNG